MCGRKALNSHHRPRRVLPSTVAWLYGTTEKETMDTVLIPSGYVPYSRYGKGVSADFNNKRMRGVSPPQSPVCQACFEVNTVFPLPSKWELWTRVVIHTYTWRNNELGFLYQKKGLISLGFSHIIRLSEHPGIFTQTFPVGKEPGHAPLCDLVFSLDSGPLLGWSWPLLPLAGQLSLTFPSVPKVATVGLDL